MVVSYSTQVNVLEFMMDNKGIKLVKILLSYFNYFDTLWVNEQLRTNHEIFECINSVFAS